MYIDLLYLYVEFIFVILLIKLAPPLGLESDKDFVVPLGFHDDVANLDDAVLGEGIAKVLNGRRV